MRDKPMTYVERVARRKFLIDCAVNTATQRASEEAIEALGA